MHTSAYKRTAKNYRVLTYNDMFSTVQLGTN